MRYIIGIAPAQKSITMRDGRLIAWCPNTECGKRLRTLVDEDPRAIFRNASDIKPKLRLKNDKLVDRQPWAARGRDLLIDIADSHDEPEPAKILVLGLDYWRRALGLLADAKRITHSRYKIPTATPFGLHRDDGIRVAEVTLLPHPSLWPVSAGRDRQEYRAFTIDCLARQNYRVGAGEKRLLEAADYDQVFKSFDF